MYSASHHPVSSASMNGMGGGMIDDGSGTINPAALNTPVLAANTINASPRGQKRSRSPDVYNEPRGGATAEDEEARQRKRGRPSKSRLSGGEIDVSAAQAQQQNQQIPTQSQTARAPAVQSAPRPQSRSAPSQASPAAKTTPAKPVVKALPTVRDHTTDQLTTEGDEYIPREYDEAGEKKVAPNGKPQDGREYKCRTFLVPNRGDKLFMLATECARVLGYRDSYLLFNKNRSLFKIIASQPEKDDLIGQEILPYSYRSRQIAIVTAKSMFRQFGSRVITNGRRVRDDYWEAKAKKQGFTEEDLAGEKRPGGAKAAREAQAAEAANAMGHHQDVVYSNGPGTIPVDAHGHPQLMQAGMTGPMASSLAPLPMISLAPSDDMRLREYNNIPRPRQEMTGAPYQDRTQPSSMTDIMNQATHTNEFNKILNSQQKQRGKDMNDFYRHPREVNVSSPLQQSNEAGPTIGQTIQSPHLGQGQAISAGQQPIMHQTPQMMNSQSYPQQQQQHHQQNPSPSPARNIQQIRQDQAQPHRSSSLSYGSSAMPQSSYGYSQSSQMWGQPPPQPQQQSPHAAHHTMPQYSPQQPHQSQSPHHSQSPHQHPQQPPTQLQHSQSGGSMHGGMSYQNMPSMAQPYGAGMAARGMYQQPPQQSPSPHQYMQQTTTSGGAPLQGWAPPPQQGHGGQQGWQSY